jgi:N-acetylglutamate synthase-like GNAT family acetyltransferase
MSRPDPAQPLGEKPVVRQAAIGDVPTIHHLLEIYASKGNLLPRTLSEIYRHLRDFFVIEIGDKVVACAALEIFTEDLGEVRSLVVDEAPDHGADLCAGVLPQTRFQDRGHGHAAGKGLERVREVLQVQQLR